MEYNQQNLRKYIALGVVLLVFVPFLFAGHFSQVPPFSMFRHVLFGGTPDSGSVVQDLGVSQEDLADLSDPVTVFDLVVGEGDEAVTGTMVRVGYIGTYIDAQSGEEVTFDQNVDPDSGFSFMLGSGQVISGFAIGVMGMRVGGKRLVVIQPEMGYGDQQTGAIPPNTTLRFLIELYEVAQ